MYRLIFFMITLFVASMQSVEAQMDPPSIDSLDCEAYLSFLSDAMKWDTLGGKGIKLAATEYVFAHGCSFVGMPISSIVNHYGVPDVKFKWNESRKAIDRVFSFRYKLLTAKFGDKYTYGDKWLHITTNAERVITMAVIHTIDE